MSATVYELRHEPTTLGGAVGIMPNGLRLLARLGVLEHLLARGSSNPTLTVRSLRSGTLATQDMVQGISELNGGYGYLRLKRTDLVGVLVKAVSEAGIPIHFNKSLVKIEEIKDTAVKVTFSDGSTDTADVLLGCDGIHSAVRRLYVDPALVPVYTGFSGLGAIIDCPKDLPAREVQGINATLTTEGVLGVMSCSATEDQVFWGVSKQVPLPTSGDTRDGWEVKREEEVADFKENLLELLAGARGQWGTIIRTLVGETQAVKFYPVFKLPFGGSWYKGRCLLLGDAAHAMPPHAGQGTSQAIEDVFLIARLLADPSRPLHDAFAKYEQIRRPRVVEITNQATRNAGIRKKTSPWGLWVKELAIWAYFSVAALLNIQVGRGMRKQVLYNIEDAEI